MVTGPDEPVAVGEVKVTTAVHAPALSFDPGMVNTPHDVADGVMMALCDVVRVSEPRRMLSVQLPLRTTLSSTFAPTSATCCAALQS
jgi:hypothetical protein